jgi:hypothetical protein
MNKEKRGRPYEFPENFIFFMAFVHVLFLPYRQMEGFLRKLSEYIPHLKTADFTTLHKRIQKIEQSLPEVKEEKDLVIALDSTGVKVTNRDLRQIERSSIMILQSKIGMVGSERSGG